MFSSIFGRRKSPVEDVTPPIPGPKTDDFVIVDPTSPGGSLYPSVSGGSVPVVSPKRPAPPAPKKIADQSFHYLQGVPFSLCRELQMASNKDTFAAQIADQLAFLTNKVNLNSYEYEFSLERSVLKELE
ncbi:uncharacterized protein LOC113520832 [Galleria mellonella]|uniref:Uncharacterized protein LOC113520832 n=1 Tax=Galleria mellonella TaxID=7137 RepID=A0A6J1WZP1_GALME|nr:uncharacterized protein LOC113520832 [Galleria mellonella]